MKLSQDIKMFRAKYRLTQTEFAEMCGVTPMTISNLERGTQHPKETTEMRLRYIMQSYEKGRKTK